MRKEIRIMILLGYHDSIRHAQAKGLARRIQSAASGEPATALELEIGWRNGAKCPNIGATWQQNGTKNGPKTEPRRGTPSAFPSKTDGVPLLGSVSLLRLDIVFFSCGSWARLGAVLAPKMGQVTPKVTPKTNPTGVLGRFEGFLGPQINENPEKMEPRMPSHVDFIRKIGFWSILAPNFQPRKSTKH